MNPPRVGGTSQQERSSNPQGTLPTSLSELVGTARLRDLGGRCAQGDSECVVGSALPREGVDLPDITIADVDDRVEREQPGGSDGLLEVLDLGETVVHLGVRRKREAGLPSEQDALGSNRELGPKAQEAQHVGHRGGREAFPELLEIAADRVFRNPALADELEKLGIGVEAHPQPVAGAAFAEARMMKERGDKETLGYKPQEGVIVSRIVQEHIPGDMPGEAMPSNPQYLSHPGFDSPDDPQVSFMRCAQELHAQFQAFSDRKFMLMSPEMRAGVTLVTVVLTPIIALPRPDVGVELLCEFHQKTRFGFVDADSFDVFSEIGEYPIQVPTDGDMRAMFQTFDQFKAEDAARRA